MGLERRKRLRVGRERGCTSKLEGVTVQARAGPAGQGRKSASDLKEKTLKDVGLKKSLWLKGGEQTGSSRGEAGRKESFPLGRGKS